LLVILLTSCHCARSVRVLPSFPTRRSSDLLAGPQAGGADPDPAGGATAGRRPHHLDVGNPAPLGPPVRVGHVVAEARLLAADVAHAGHGMLLQGRRSLPEIKGARQHGQPEQTTAPPGGNANPPPAAPARDRGRPRTPGYGGASAALCAAPVTDATRLRPVLETLDAVAVRRWCAAGLTALRRHEHEINQLNVYPVPDGDTGTNLALTLGAAQRALAAQPDGDGPAAALRAMARGALLGARGNSGVIVAQLLRGLADTLASASAVGGRELADALTSAAKASYAAVAEPVEGTILSVATAAARAAVGSGGQDGPNPAPGSLLTVVRAAADAAATALARTPEQLPALAAAGVVDAGGRGLVVVVDALVGVASGPAPQGAAEPPPRRPRDPPERSLDPPAAGTSPVPVDGCEPAGYAYEVQYLLDAEDAAVAGLRATLAGLGDSLVVVGTGDGTWKVH